MFASESESARSKACPRCVGEGVRGLDVAPCAIGSLKSHRLWQEVLDWPNDPQIPDAKVKPALLEHWAETVLEQPARQQLADSDRKLACQESWPWGQASCRVV